MEIYWKLVGWSCRHPLIVVFVEQVDSKWTNVKLISCSKLFVNSIAL